MKFDIPQSIKTEHNELHKRLEEATKMPGDLGKAASMVAELLHPHFIKEEEYALPPLGLLPSIAEGKISSDMQAVTEMTRRLKSELQTMVKEHGTIVSALDKLRSVARKENKDDIVKFADDLLLHAQIEEEVLYPASILIGDYIQMKLNL